MREAVLTASPNKQYRGIVNPTTPAQTERAQKRPEIWWDKQARESCIVWRGTSVDSDSKPRLKVRQVFHFKLVDGVEKWQWHQRNLSRVLTSVAHWKSRHHHVRVANCLDLRKIVKKECIILLVKRYVHPSSGREIWEWFHRSPSRRFTKLLSKLISRWTTFSPTAISVGKQTTNPHFDVTSDVIEERVDFVQHGYHLQSFAFLWRRWRNMYSRKQVEKRGIWRRWQLGTCMHGFLRNVLRCCHRLNHSEHWHIHSSKV